MGAARVVCAKYRHRTRMVRLFDFGADGIAPGSDRSRRPYRSNHFPSLGKSDRFALLRKVSKSATRRAAGYSGGDIMTPLEIILDHSNKLAKDLVAAWAECDRLRAE